MEHISSDTNVWIDFVEIDMLDLPFRLPYVYLMNDEAMEDELLSPPGLGAELLRLGLQKTELTEDEFFMAEEFVRIYSGLSIYDCIALAIAKVRGIILLTGDRLLRKTAEYEDVKVIGTIGIVDRLRCEGYIENWEYERCIRRLLEKNGGKVRLPKHELEKRLEEIQSGK